MYQELPIILCCLRPQHTANGKSGHPQFVSTDIVVSKFQSPVPRIAVWPDEWMDGWLDGWVSGMGGGKASLGFVKITPQNLSNAGVRNLIRGWFHCSPNAAASLA